MSDELQGQRVVLIGGAGFIGHHLALALRQRGAIPHVIDSLEVNHLGSFRRGLVHTDDDHLYVRQLEQRLDLLRRAEVHLHVHDARDPRKVRELFDRIQPQVVLHLAAVAHADRAERDPDSSRGHSLQTLETALRSSHDHAERFVYFSSSMVYGHFTSPVVTELTDCRPASVYGAQKLEGERLVRAAGLPHTIIRPSALYGERCVSRRVIQVFIERALRGEPLTITGDGSSRLDFTHVNDLVDGTLQTVTSPEARYETFNITFGDSRSLQDLVGVLRERFPGLQVTYGSRLDDGSPTRGTLSVDKARELLGYSPRYSIERGLPTYVDWYQKLLGGSVAPLGRNSPRSDTVVEPT